MKKLYSYPIMDIEEFKVVEIMTYSDFVAKEDIENPDTEF